MVRQILIFFFCLQANFIQAQMQKIIGDCTISYNINEGVVINNNLSGTVLQLYIKGNQSRFDIISPTYSQSTIFDNNTRTGIILQQVGENKYMSKLDSLQWKEQNKKYDGMSILYRPDKKIILGYECKKAKVELKDGSSFILYYTPGVLPSNRENPYKFKDIPGLVLEYEAEGMGKKNNIIYTASKIDFNPVPSSKFEIPKKGYLIRDN